MPREGSSAFKRLSWAVRWRFQKLAKIFHFCKFLSTTQRFNSENEFLTPKSFVVSACLNGTFCFYSLNTIVTVVLPLFIHLAMNKFLKCFFARYHPPSLLHVLTKYHLSRTRVKDKSYRLRAKKRDTCKQSESVSAYTAQDHYHC